MPSGSGTLIHPPKSCISGLRAEVPPADAARIKQALKETPGVKRVSFVSPKQAKQRLMRNLGPDAKVVADVEESFLPASYEVTLGGSPGAGDSGNPTEANLPGPPPPGHREFPIP